MRTDIKADHILDSRRYHPEEKTWENIQFTLKEGLIHFGYNLESTDTLIIDWHTEGSFCEVYIDNIFLGDDIIWADKPKAKWTDYDEDITMGLMNWIIEGDLFFNADAWIGNRNMGL
jgi:hypothetical protein